MPEPFALLRPFEDHLSVALFTKTDDIRTDVAAAQTFGLRDAAGLCQMHGNRTVVVRAPSNRTIEADGMITDVPDLALCIRFADCQNFVLYAPERHVCGVLHVGWRGLIAGAIPEFFRVMKGEWGIAPSETFVGAGPSLCTTCSDFSDPKGELPSIPKRFIHGKCVDLQRAATQQLVDLGVSPDRIERHPDCTRCRPELYWTYRGGDRDAVKTGHSNMLACTLKRI